MLGRGGDSFIVLLSTSVTISTDGNVQVGSIIDENYYKLSILRMSVIG
jgi:hypothetical protein